MSISEATYVISCGNCGLKQLCIPHALAADEIEKLDEIVKRKKPLRRGELLYQRGDEFKSLYAVRAGSIKLYSVDEDGEEQVIAFYLPGEILGLDAIDTEEHQTYAVALETSSVCELPYSQTEELAREVPNLQVHVYRMLSREIRLDQELQLLLTKRTAEERIGAFLLNLSIRYEQRQLSPSRFRLPMSRSDIGSYLGLAVETVSRVFTKLQTQDIVKVEGKELEILSRPGLCEVAHMESSNHKH